MIGGCKCCAPFEYAASQCSVSRAVGALSLMPAYMQWARMPNKSFPPKIRMYITKTLKNSNVVTVPAHSEA